MRSEVRIDGDIGVDDVMRPRQMRLVLVRRQRSGLTLREFGQQRRIPPSTLSWWRQVFRRAGEKKMNRAPAENAVLFTEVPQQRSFRGQHRFWSIVLRSGHIVRVPAAADTDALQRVLQALQTHADAAGVGAGFRGARGATDLRRSFDRLSAQVQGGLWARPIVRPRVRVLQPPTHPV